MKKTRKWLSNYEAKFLGLEPKENAKGRTQARYNISQDDFERVQYEFRNKGVRDSCDKLEVDPTTVKHLWKKTKDESVFVKNPLYVSQEEKTYLDLRDAILDDLKKFEPKHTKIKRKALKRGLVKIYGLI